MSVDLGRISLLGADAVGQPGQRRFRLFVEGVGGSALMWLEKEHLNSLSLALDRLLALITEGQVLRIEAQAGDVPQSGTMPASFPLTPTYEFQVGQMKLNYDEQESNFSLTVTSLESVIEQESEQQSYVEEGEAVTFIFTIEEAQALSSSIARVVSAGRPVCPLCHAPLDGGPHACVKQNGHREILLIEEREDENEE
jgi:uncharacterized repeat protein (TIGR03847 family)